MNRQNNTNKKLNLSYTYKLNGLLSEINDLDQVFYKFYEQNYYLYYWYVIKPITKLEDRWLLTLFPHLNIEFRLPNYDFNLKLPFFILI